ncbi:MAG: hypothetical protein JO102_02045 [Elusimicrobia bacterium]|nr:hypothetical protein [Elusimicrobiota bacterium]
MTVVSSLEGNQPLPAVTSIFSALRAVRGNVRRDFDFHGVVALQTGLVDPRRSAAELIAADAGLESWVAGWTPASVAGTPLMCGGREMNAGIAAVEWLSEQPWGIASVDLSAFQPNQDALREAVRASVRAAEIDLRGQKPAAGIIVMSAKRGAIPSAAARDAFLGAAGGLPKIPLLGLPAKSAFARAHNSALAISEDSVTCLLVPE